jgi:hypothetical protein
MCNLRGPNMENVVKSVSGRHIVFFTEHMKIVANPRIFIHLALCYIRAQDIILAYPKCFLLPQYRGHPNDE